MVKQLSKFICCTGLSIIITLHLFSQQNAALWKSLFNKPFDAENTLTQILWEAIQSKPKEEILQIISLLEADKNISKSKANEGKLSLLKLRFCKQNNGQYKGISWKIFGEDALRMATINEDVYLLQSSCCILGDIYLNDGKSDTALFYLVRAALLAEQLGYNKEAVLALKISASNALYQTQDYAQCISFCKTDIDIEKTFPSFTVISAYNNTGLSYLRLKKPDSAIYFFTKAANYSNKVKWGVWEGITTGNIGDAYHAKGKTDAAMSLWKKDYDSCVKYLEWPNAGLTLAFMSEYQFNKGQRQGVFDKLRWAKNVNFDDKINLVRIYKIQAECYRKINRHDSADAYFEKYYALSDSLQRVIYRSNYNALQLKLENEMNIKGFKLLKKQRQTEIIRRNLLLIALLSFLLIGILLFNRQRLNIKLARQQQSIAEAEKDSAKEQLNIFTQTLLEKNEQIENLHASLKLQHAVTNDELIHQTLLTDYDWNRFKDLFEKIHSGFFSQLKNMAPGITQSEMRMAALIKLNLDNKQMASMQGISISSLRGNKTRLRQKLNISVETDLENLLKQL